MNVRLKDVVTTNARALPETTDPGFAFRYIDIGAVSQGHIEVPQDELRFETAPSRARRLAEPGDTVVSTVRTYLRAVARVPKAPEPLVFSTGFAVLHPNGDHIDDRYLGYYCTSAPFIESVVARSVGVSYPAINASEVADVRLDLPPLDEQRRIADYLDAETARLDHLLEVRAVQSQRLSERRSSLLLTLVGSTECNGEPSGLEWLPTIPAHWSAVRLSLLARLGSGHTPSRSHPEWWIDRTIPWITTGEVAQMRSDQIEDIHGTRELISLAGLQNSAAEVHPRGTVVLCRTAASAGYSAVMGREMATSQDFATWTCGPRLDPYFLLWTLRAMRPWLLGARAMGSTHKTIYMPDIQALRVPLPPLAEQHSIVALIRTELGQLDRVRDALATQSALLRERRQALVTAAVKGQLDVTTAG